MEKNMENEMETEIIRSMGVYEGIYRGYIGIMGKKSGHYRDYKGMIGKIL